MKTFKSLGLSISMMMASLLSLNMGVAARPSQSEGTPILISQESPELIGTPRSGSAFFAEYSEYYILLGATASCGTVTIRITSTAGDDYSTYFDTSTGVILLPISGDAGHYVLSITTLDGIHFIGEFTL